MSTILLETKINAPIERCFDLSRSIDLHVASTSKTSEKAISGRTTGLIGLGEYVTWKAKHFGITQQLTTIITSFNSPFHFIDEMEKGIFKSFRHQHIFKKIQKDTIMVDEFEYELPCSFIGKLIDALVLKRYLTDFLKQRNAIIKEFAETDRWKNLLTD